MVQVYAVLYLAKENKQGPFLMAKKLQQGYFFADKKALVPQGQVLNNPEGYALPGGSREENDKDIIAAAAREFKEETGEAINEDVLKSQLDTIARKEFAAVYFPVKSETVFKRIIQGLNEENLPQARQAAKKVQNGQIKDYKTIEEMHKEGCPLSDELAAVYEWDVTNKANWETIVRWKEDQFVNGWTYQILLYFKMTILHFNKDYIS